MTASAVDKSALAPSSSSSGQSDEITIQMAALLECSKRVHKRKGGL